MQARIDRLELLVSKLIEAERTSQRGLQVLIARAEVDSPVLNVLSVAAAALLGHAYGHCMEKGIRELMRDFQDLASKLGEASGKRHDLYAKQADEAKQEGPPHAPT